MKARSVIERRLRYLRGRYLQSHLRGYFERRPSACVHNHEQPVSPLPYSTESFHTELELSPRKVTTLVVVNQPSPVRLCMLGSDDPGSWAGDMCDTIEKSASCPYFRPRVTMDQARASFDAMMADDRHVLRHYPDVATLQWVLGTRLRKLRMGLFERLALWWKTRGLKELPAPEPEDDLPEDFWR